MFNNALKNLLTENKNALQFVNSAAGMDFTKPFKVYEGRGPVTVNKIKKTVAADIPGAVNIAVLMHKSHFNSLFYCYIKSGKLRGDRVAALPYWDYNIDWFWGVRPVEDARKDPDNHYYIVAQSAKYELPRRARDTDYTARYCVVNVIRARDIYNTKQWISGATVKYTDGKRGNTKFEFSAMSWANSDITQYIDKSGYNVFWYRCRLWKRGLDYKKAQALKAVKAADFAPTLADIDSKTEQARAYVTSLAQTAKTADNFKFLADTARDVSRLIVWGDMIRDRINSGFYTSLDAVKTNTDTFNKDYNKIMGAL